MGKYEDQLKAMGTADAEWKIEEFAALESQMTQLKLDMQAIAKNPGWTGASADAASALFVTLKDAFEENEKKLATAKSAIDKANEIRATAVGKQNSLPDSEVPDWVHAAALVGGAVLVPVPGIGIFAAESVVQKVNEFMGAQREAAALQALETMNGDLAAPKGTLTSNTISGEVWPEAAPPPDWPGDPVVWNGDDTGSGSWSTAGAVPWTGGGSIIEGPNGYQPTTPEEPEVIICYPPNPPVQLPPVNPPGWPENSIITPPAISIDGDSGGSNPGGIGGGGLGMGLAGAGMAGGLGAAKLASKGGLGGAGGLFGPNGLLGGGANGAGGANGGGSGAGAKAGAGGAGAGAKGGATGMMGGGGGGAGGSEKNKRSSLGLMAPKLEDDEENGPRSAAAGAGGRE